MRPLVEFAFWSRVEGRGSRVNGRGSRVNGRGSKKLFKIIFKLFSNLFQGRVYSSFRCLFLPHLGHIFVCQKLLHSHGLSGGIQQNIEYLEQKPNGFLV